MQKTRSIAVLPDHIASQIAAGEVIERPASVVKELVENSLDSGASRIEIAVSSNCRDIRVADNGCGMMPDDAVLAFQRHATSKLRSVEDLWKLSSLGFRGEALPSIGAISRMTCYTRPHDAPSGTKVYTDNGKIHATETGCAPGTVMEVVDLFHNVPARLKFLKKASTEFGHIQEIVQSLAIASPRVCFQLEKEGTVILRTSGSDDFSRAAIETGLVSHEQSTLSIDTVGGSGSGPNRITIRGLIGRPIHFRGDRKGIVCIVNGRPVRCPVTYKALDYAYSDLIPKGRYPIAMLLIDLAPGEVDINIHPTKKEIKYSNGNEVYSAVLHVLTKTLRQQGKQYFGEHDTANGAKYKPAAVTGFPGTAKLTSITEFETEHVSPPDSALSIAEFPIVGATPCVARSLTEDVLLGNSATVGNDLMAAREQPSNYSENFLPLGFRETLTYVPGTNVANDSLLVQEGAPGAGEGLPLKRPYVGAKKKLVGYLHNTYILLETTEGLEIIEQHIAHERVLYEKILSQQKSKGRLSESAQRLVISVPLQLTPEQNALIQEHMPLFNSLGFEFETEQGNTVCTQVPLELAHRDYASVVQQLLAELVACGKANMELEATKSLACQAAIKNGMALSTSDILKLLNEWGATERKDSCPHGRPVCLAFSKEKLFQMFHPG